MSATCGVDHGTHGSRQFDSSVRNSFVRRGTSTQAVETLIMIF